MRRSLAAATLAMLFALVSSAPAGALDDPVDIRAELDWPGHFPGAIVYEALGVTPGPGPELTPANLVVGQSPWSGDLVVDIDPEARTITVEPAVGNDALTVIVLRITSSTITNVQLVSSDFGQTYDGSVLEIVHGAGEVTLTWTRDASGSWGFFVTDGTAVFSYDIAGQGEGADDDAPADDAPADDAPADAGPADPVVAEPTFAG